MKLPDLAKLARGKPCQFRFAGICRHDDATTVLAHVNIPGNFGMGIKSPSLCAGWADFDCHRFIDNRDLSGFERDLRASMMATGEFYEALLGGVLRTLAQVQGIIES